MKIFVAILLLSLIVVGCVRSGYWTKPGFDNSQWQMDSYRCDHEAQVSSQYWNPNQGIIMGVMAYKRNLESCIRAHGYFWVNK